LLQREDAGQRAHDLREVFNDLRYIVKTGTPWRWMSNDLPPWAAVYQQPQQWLAAGCFEGLVTVLRLAAGRKSEPTAAIIDSRTLRSTPESSERAGYDSEKRKKGSKIYMAVDTLRHLLALHVTPASADDRGEVERLGRTVQAVTNETVELAWVDQGYTGERAANAATKHGIALEVVNCPRPNADLSSCHDAGSSNDHSHGRPASDASSKITISMPKHWQDSTSSHSPAL
jgi:transposase